MERFRLIEKKIMHQGWSSLARFTYNYQNDQGKWQTQVREAYDRGNGMTVLLFNPDSKSVILTKQFRLPPFLNGHSTGQMVETCAGKLENENPDNGMIREIEEETGYRVPSVQKIFEIYMSPGSVTELIHFYIARYDSSMKVSSGGGLDAEQENITVIEISLKEALMGITNGEIKDAKTIMLLQYAQIHNIMNY